MALISHFFAILPNCTEATVPLLVDTLYEICRIKVYTSQVYPVSEFRSPPSSPSLLIKIQRETCRCIHIPFPFRSLAFGSPLDLLTTVGSGHTVSTTQTCTNHFGASLSARRACSPTCDYWPVGVSDLHHRDVFFPHPDAPPENAPLSWKQTMIYIRQVMENSMHVGHPASLDIWIRDRSLFLCWQIGSHRHCSLTSYLLSQQRLRMK